MVGKLAYLCTPLLYFPLVITKLATANTPKFAQVPEGVPHSSSLGARPRPSMRPSFSQAGLWCHAAIEDTAHVRRNCGSVFGELYGLVSINRLSSCQPDYPAQLPSTSVLPPSLSPSVWEVWPPLSISRVGFSRLHVGGGGYASTIPRIWHHQFFMHSYPGICFYPTSKRSMNGNDLRPIFRHMPRSQCLGFWKRPPKLK